MTSVPDKHRLILAISLALLVHTLVLVLAPAVRQPEELASTTLRFSLVQSASLPAPAPSTTSSQAPAIPTPPASADRKPENNTEVSPNPAIANPVPAAPKSQQSRPPETPSRPLTPPSPAQQQSRTPADTATPHPLREPGEDRLNQLTTRTAEQDPYAIRLVQRIAEFQAGHSVAAAVSALPEPVTVTLDLQLLPSGTLTRATIIGSSGHDSIDRAAYRTALAASPYPEPPEDVKDRKSFQVKLTYTPERL